MSLSELLQEKRVPWAKLRCEELEVDGDVDLNTATITNIAADNVTIEEELELQAGATVSGDIILGGKILSIDTISTTKDISGESFTPTVHPNQNRLSRVKRIIGPVTATGAQPFHTTNIELSRVGRSITCRVNESSVAPCTVQDAIEFNLGLIPGYVIEDFAPNENQISCTYGDIGVLTIEVSGQNLIIKKVNPTTGLHEDFKTGDNMNWTQSLCFSYIADFE